MDYRLIKSIDCNQGSLRAVRYNVDGNYCLTCGSDRKLKLLNPKTGLILKTYAGHGEEVTDAVGSCDSSHILSGSVDKSIIYWDVATGIPERRVRNHAAAVSVVRFNEDSTLAITGSRDNTVKCFDIRSRSIEPIQTMKQAKDCITGLHVNQNKIISSSLDGCIRFYDIRAGELVCDAINVPITSMSLTSDEQCVLAACQDGVIRLIDVDGGDSLLEYKGHEPRDYKIELTTLKSDGFVISGTSFGSAVIWSFIDAKEVKRLRVTHQGGVVTSLARHPVGEDLIIANRREIQLWSMDEPEEETMIVE